MTDEEAEKIVEDMQRIFPNLPDPVHEPIRAAYYIKLYKHMKDYYYNHGDGKNQ